MKERRHRQQKEYIKKDYDTEVVEIRRVTRVVAGGKRMRFRALVVTGDRAGKIGIGLKKGTDVAEAVSKATTQSRKNLIVVPLLKDTIPHAVLVRYKAAEVLIKPAKAGSGIIAGGPVRAVMSLAGVKNVSAKMLGSSNKVSNVRATFEALKRLKSPNNKS